MLKALARLSTLGALSCGVIALSSTAGCITTPSAQNRSSEAPFILQGLGEPGQLLGIYSVDRLHAEPGTEPEVTPLQRFVPLPGQGFRFVDVVVEPGTGATSRGLSPWSEVIDPLVLPAFHWAPQLESEPPGLGTSVGRAELAVFRVRDLGGREYERFGTRLPLVPLSSVDEPDDTFVAFDNDGVGVAALPLGGGWVRTAQPLAGSFLYGTIDIPDLRTIVMELGDYEVPVATGAPLRVYGVVCRPAADGVRYPALILNHGGYELGVGDLAECLYRASQGWLVAASAYRYEGVSRRLASGVPLPGLPDTIDIMSRDPEAPLAELCLGEVADVLRWTQLIRARGDVDRTRVVMAGLSHGGCVTLRAVQQGADVDAAVAVVPFTIS